MSNPIHLKVNYEVLKWARETIALPKGKAAENLGMSVTRLQQLEAGQKTPTLDELKAMSKTYKRTIATLLLHIPPQEKALPNDRRTVNSKELNVFHDKTILAVRKARALVNALISLKEENGINIAVFNKKTTLLENPTEVARRLRTEWSLDDIREIKNLNFALEAYVEKIESLGIAVFQLSLVQDKLRGFSIVDEAIPAIAMKRSDQVTGKIFTLFHEVAHILLHTGGLCDVTFNSKAQDIEKWCNAFAGEMLVPSTDLKRMDIIQKQVSQNQKTWNKKDLVQLGVYFHVGPLVILRRLLDNNLTTPAFYKAKHEAWNKPSFGRSKHPEGRNPAKETIKEKGRNYIALAFQAFDQNKIDLKDLSDFLGIKLSYIPKTRQLLTV
jgi:Zn-dependent peptidase ImmA (M78 family)